MPKWEYKVERLAGVQVEKQLSFLGNDGWEWVQVIDQTGKDYPLLCILKRTLKRKD